MDQILAALIIACSNINQPSAYRSSTSEVMRQKKDCLQRVINCSVSYRLNNKTYNTIEFASKCSKDVY